MNLLAAVLFASAVPAETVALRYDLRPGDHLVYRQTLEREGTSPEGEFLTRQEWTSHALAWAAEDAAVVVGFQRNRGAAELVRVRGGEGLARERAQFAARLPRPRFAEANRLTDRGGAELPWSALRESASELLPALHEILPLPPQPVRAGDSWSEGGRLGLEARAVAWEDVHGRRALRIEADGLSGDARLVAWFSPESGLVERLEFKGRYSVVNTRLDERLVIELSDRRRAEDPRGWLTQADTREGALAAMFVADASVDADGLYGLLDSQDPVFDRQILAYALRRRLAPPPAEAQGWLGADPRLAALLDLLGSPPPPAAGANDGCALPPRRAPSEPPGTTLRPMTAPGYEGWPYAMHVPEEYRGAEPLPLLVWLTGGRGRATLGLSQAREALSRTGWLVVYPEAPELWWGERATRLVAALLDEVIRRFNVDADRVYVAGMSNGATGAYRYAALWPDRFAAAASLMGAGPYVKASDTPLPENLDGVPMLFAHGDRDPIIPKSASEETVKALRRAVPGAELELRILSGRGHDLDLGSDDALVTGFLRGRARDPFRRRVRLALRGLEYARRHWVEVLEKEGGVASVEAEIGPDNTVALRTRKVRRLRLLLRRELLPAAGPFRVMLDGREVFSGPLVEDCGLLERTARETGDTARAWSAELTFDVPR